MESGAEALSPHQRYLLTEIGNGWNFLIQILRPINRNPNSYSRCIKQRISKHYVILTKELSRHRYVAQTVNLSSMNVAAVKRLRESLRQVVHLS